LPSGTQTLTAVFYSASLPSFPALSDTGPIHIGHSSGRYRTPFRTKPDTLPIPSENCPTSARTTVRLQSERCPLWIGTLSDFKSDWCPVCVGIRMDGPATHRSISTPYFLGRLGSPVADRIAGSAPGHEGTTPVNRPNRSPVIRPPTHRVQPPSWCTTVPAVPSGDFKTRESVVGFQQTIPGAD